MKNNIYFFFLFLGLWASAQQTQVNDCIRFLRENPSTGVLQSLDPNGYCMNSGPNLLTIHTINNAVPNETIVQVYDYIQSAGGTLANPITNTTTGVPYSQNGIQITLPSTRNFGQFLVKWKIGSIEYQSISNYRLCTGLPTGEFSIPNVNISCIDGNRSYSFVFTNNGILAGTAVNYKIMDNRNSLHVLQRGTFNYNNNGNSINLPDNIWGTIFFSWVNTTTGGNSPNGNYKTFNFNTECNPQLEFPSTLSCLDSSSNYSFKISPTPNISNVSVRVNGGAVQNVPYNLNNGATFRTPLFRIAEISTPVTISVQYNWNGVSTTLTKTINSCVGGIRKSPGKVIKDNTINAK